MVNAEEQIERENITLNWPESRTDWAYSALSPAYAKGVAYVDGQYIPVSEARIPLLDWGFTRSDACQDTISVWNGSFFRLEDHLERFERSWSALRLVCPLTRNEVRDVVHKLVAAGGFQHAYVQIIMTRGKPPIGGRDPRQCENRFQAFAIPYVWIATPQKQQAGMHLHISGIRRVPATSVSPLIKHFHWLDFEQGLFEALDLGADTVVLLNSEGHIAEGPGFNIFAVLEGTLVTPATSVLDGMTRRTVLELAASLSTPTVERELAVHELTGASEVFLTTTAGGILPVSMIDGKIISEGPGRVTARLHEAYWKLRTHSPLVSPATYWPATSDRT
jgi:branched-chain amino acid aminotransferase